MAPSWTRGRSSESCHKVSQKGVSYRIRGTSQSRHVAVAAVRCVAVAAVRFLQPCAWSSFAVGVTAWGVVHGRVSMYSRCNMVCDSKRYWSFCAHSERQQQQKQQQLHSTEHRSMSKLLIWIFWICCWFPVVYVHHIQISQSDCSSRSVLNSPKMDQWGKSDKFEFMYWIFPQGKIGVLIKQFREFIASNFSQGKNWMGLFRCTKKSKSSDCANSSEFVEYLDRSGSL